ncbi:MAG: hypothetical protein LAT76_12845, partial [Schleiferiaceae bacterium]|nr:hypothetical protein [Schleiferiaceae bacterium]
MRKFVLILLVALFSATGYEASATHTYGGEITWICDQDPNSPTFGQFRFFLYLFRDCSPNTATLGNNYTINTNAPGGNIPVTRISQSDVSPTCAVGTGGNIVCGSAPPSGYTGTNGKGPIELHVYQSTWRTMAGTPPATGWQFTWSLCCRPTNVLNLTNSSGQQHTLRAFMYPYNPGGGAASTSPCFDSSPTFLEPPSLI